MSKKLVGVLAVIVVITGISLIAYSKHKQAYGSGQYYEGTVRHFNCYNAGVGCEEYTLLESSESVGLSGSSATVLNQYVGKQVRVKGSLESYAGPPGGKYIQVESIQLK